MIKEDNKESINNYAWVILAVVYLTTFASHLMFNKVPPLILNLIDEFGVTLGQAGWLMSMLGLTGLIMALPAGIILQRRGLRLTGIVALGLIASGAGLGALSGSFLLLLVSRLLEGLGSTLLVVLAPAAIAMWFPREKVGTSMGIWTTAGPVTAIVIVTLAPLWAQVIGWRGVWWITAAVSVAMMVVYWLFVRSPPRLEAAGLADENGNMPEAAASWKKALRNRDIWLVGLAFLIFNLLVTPFLTYYVTFLASVHGYTQASAGFIFSLTALATIPSALLTGWLSDFLGTRKWVAFTAFLILGPLFVMVFQASGAMIIVFLLLLNLFAISIPVSLLAAVPDMMSDVRLVGIGMAVILIGQNLGLIIGPPLFGGLVENTGWGVAAIAFAPLCLLGAVVILLTRKMP